LGKGLLASLFSFCHKQRASLSPFALRCLALEVAWGRFSVCALAHSASFWGLTLIQPLASGI